MTLVQKGEILYLLKNGIDVAEADHRYVVNKSSNRGIHAAEAMTWCSVRESASVSAKLSFVSHRDPLLEKLENISTVG